MNGDVAKENLEQSGVVRTQNRAETFDFLLRDLPGLVAHLTKPKAPKKMRRRLGNNFDLVVRESFLVLAFLRYHQWADIPESSDLPINVTHLRFQERRAIKGDDRARLRR